MSTKFMLRPFVWAGELHELVDTLEWRLWFYGIALGPFGIGVIRREHKETM